MWKREFGDLPAFVDLPLDCDPNDLSIVDDAVELGRDPRIRAELRAFALERCDWAYRVRDILTDADIPVPVAVERRIAELGRQREQVLSNPLERVRPRGIGADH